MGFADELLYIMSGDGVGIPRVNMFRSSGKVLPTGAGPFLSVIDTGGSGADNTQNSVIRPAYELPTAQIVVRADTYAVAYAMARAAMISVQKIRNQYIGSGIFGPTGTWYRKIKPLQSEPADGGLDPSGRPRSAFNVLGDKRPS
jgi:hypothetical protein